VSQISDTLVLFGFHLLLNLHGGPRKWDHFVLRLVTNLEVLIRSAPNLAELNVMLFWTLKHNLVESNLETDVLPSSYKWLVVCCLYGGPWASYRRSWKECHFLAFPVRYSQTPQPSPLAVYPPYFLLPPKIRRKIIRLAENPLVSWNA